MNWKGILLLSLVIFLGVFFSFFKNTRQSQVAEGILSPRAQEFIQKQNADGAGMWTQFDFSSSASGLERVEKEERNITVQECFTFLLPDVFTIRKEEDLDSSQCAWRAQLQEPRSHLALNYQSGADLQSNSSVLLRQKETEKYREISSTDWFTEPSKIFLTEEGIDIFLQRQNGVFSISFTQSQELNESFYPAIQELAQTLEQIH